MTTSTATAEAAPPKRPNPWPNALAWARIAAGPIVGGLVLWGEAIVFTDGRAGAALIFGVATVVFVLAALTDALDGWLARATNSVTPFGAALDHAADKALTLATLIALAVTVMPIDMVVAVMLLAVREVVVAGLREGLSADGRAPPVARLGKIKAALAMGACVAVLALQPLAFGGANERVLEGVAFVARGLLWAAVAAAWISGFGYVASALRPSVAVPGQSAQID